MKPTAKICLIFLMFCWMAAPSWAQEEKAPDAGSGEERTEGVDYFHPARDYTIGPGDVLNISVWKNDDLRRLSPVLPDGKISFPLIGELMVGGKTVVQVEAEVKEKISRFVPNPVLSVSVHQMHSMIIYVIGKVLNPGRQVLNINLNVLQSLAIAGGPNPFAKRNRIKIFRETKDGTRIFNFSYDDVCDGVGLEQNIRLERGDVIVVP
ncbi:MAG: polysaccharide export protein [Desulfobacterales bacterium]|nr:polysaccharide export protein [Desulfobacterales bacterium]